MSKKEELIQLCKAVIENGGDVSKVCCKKMKCEDCPLFAFNREDVIPCFLDKKATLEVAKNFLAEVEVGVLEQKEQKSEKSYSIEEVILMNQEGKIEEGTKFISDYNAIEILPNRTLKISSLKEESDPIIFPSEMFTMVEPYLTADDFDLEEEFQILGYEGIFKKIEVYGQIKVARRFDNGEVSVYGSDFLDGEDRLIRVKN